MDELLTDPLAARLEAAGVPPAFVGQSARDGGGIGAEAVAVLAEAQVLSVLTGGGPFSQDGITRRVDPGYRPLVPAALARLAGQGLVEHDTGHSPGGTGWRLAG